MDNILKLLLGVLSVAGLIAMVTPTNMGVQPAPVQAPELAVQQPVPEVTGEELVAEEESFDAEAEEDPFAIGEPSIDGNPVNQQGQQLTDPDGQAQQPQAPVYDPASYAMPNFAGYMPPPAYNSPSPTDAQPVPDMSGQ